MINAWWGNTWSAASVTPLGGSSTVKSMRVASAMVGIATITKGIRQPNEDPVKATAKEFDICFV